MTSTVKKGNFKSDSGQKPKICIIGNLLGENKGFVTTQGLVLSGLFTASGYSVRCASSKINRTARLADIAQTIFRNRNWANLVILEVYSGLSMILADMASFLCKSFDIPLIAVLHGGNLPVFAAKNPHWVRRVLSRADLLVAPSSFLASKMKELGFEIHVIPNVIELPEYSHKLRHNLSPKLLWMRSFHSIYNPEMAIRVLAKLRTDYSDATLVMAGADKGLESEIKAMAAEMGLDESVRFPGFLDSAAKAREFSEADIYINTTRIDNMPVSVVEACAAGLPVVATNVGGISHLLENGKNGLLVRDGKADEMTEAVKKLLSDPELAERISRNARDLAESSSWPKVSRLWEDIFSRIKPRRISSERLELSTE